MARFARLTLLAVVLSVAFGCSNRSESITGVNGTTNMSGRVFMGGELSGARAEGIEVSIVGTPLVATTDAEGNFAFGAAPEGRIQLRLSRLSDGIDTVLPVIAQPNVRVELMKSRGASKPKTTELEGVVTAASSASITLLDAKSHASATAAITSSTVIRKGDHAATAADIKVGAQVHVKATVDSSSKLTATEIKIQDDEGDDDANKGKELEGKITAVSASSITVADQRTHSDVTAAITAATIIRKGKTVIAASDLVAGQQVHVRVTEAADHSLTAVEIMVQDGEAEDDGGSHAQKEFEGAISSVSAASITILDSRTHAPATFGVTSSTVIRKGHTRLTITDLKVGDRVHVKATAGSGTALVATEITLQGPSKSGDDQD